MPVVHHNNTMTVVAQDLELQARRFLITREVPNNKMGLLMAKEDPSAVVSITEEDQGHLGPSTDLL